MESLLNTKNLVFTRLPGVNGSPWPKHVTHQFYRDHSREENPWINYVYTEVTGTTFSGLSTRTTLGNTLRSLCYTYYYAE
jgi:hypothetical protein